MHDLFSQVITRVQWFVGVLLWSRVVLVPPRTLERDVGADGMRHRVGRRELMKHDAESDLHFYGSASDYSGRAGRYNGMECHDSKTAAWDN